MWTRGDIGRLIATLDAATRKRDEARKLLLRRVEAVRLDEANALVAAAERRAAEARAAALREAAEVCAAIEKEQRDSARYMARKGSHDDADEAETRSVGARWCAAKVEALAQPTPTEATDAIAEAEARGFARAIWQAVGACRESEQAELELAWSRQGTPSELEHDARRAEAEYLGRGIQRLSPDETRALVEPAELARLRRIELAAMAVAARGNNNRGEIDRLAEALAETSGRGEE